MDARRLPFLEPHAPERPRPSRSHGRRLLRGRHLQRLGHEPFRRRRVRQFPSCASHRYARADPPPAPRAQRVQAARQGRVGAAERARRGRAGDGHRVPGGRRRDAELGGPDRREAVTGPRPPAGVKVTLTAEAVVHGGETLARDEGRVVFLRGAAPGDVVEAELTGEGRFERARPLRVLQRGGVRVDPPCAIVDRCGGCPVQHVAYEAQLAAKQELTADALERIGGFARNSYELAAIVPSPKQFRYRRRARLHRTSGGGWGFAHPGSTAVEPVDECLLFEGLLQELADAARCAGELAGVTDLGLLAGETKGAIDLRVKASVTPGLRRRAEKLLDHRLVRGVTLHGEILGDPVIADPALSKGPGRKGPAGTSEWTECRRVLRVT